MKRFMRGFLVAIVGLVSVVLILMLGGFINIGARDQDPALFAWLLHTAYEQSVARSAASIEVPENLDASSRVLQGAHNFREMCIACHTPPGKSATPVNQGLNPAPPDLADLMQNRTLAEAFWVIQNGVRMTGMAAYGPTHKDEELWALVSFLQRMQGASPQTYEAIMTEALEQAPTDGDHGHRHSHSNTPQGDIPHTHDAHHGDEKSTGLNESGKRTPTQKNSEHDHEH